MNLIKNLSIIIPAYNEEDGISSVLDETIKIMEQSSINYEIIVVNDGSTDETAKIAGNKSVRLINHQINKGYGAALKTGIRKAKYPLICITDADGTYSPQYIPKLMKQIDDTDMIVGSRTGSNVAVPLMRKPAKWILNSLANYLTGIKIPDLNSGLRIFSKEVINLFSPICPNGFSFTTTITLALLTNNYSVSFIPINYEHRIGKSKIRPIRDSINFFNLIIRTIIYFAPLKIFTPISLVLALIGIGLLAYRAIIGEGLAVTIVVIFLAALQIATIGLLADMISKFTSLSKVNLRHNIKDE